MTVATFFRQPVAMWAPQVGELVRSLDGLAYVAGGAARQLVMQAEAPPAEDIDLFLYCPEAHESAINALIGLGYKIDFVSRNATTFLPRNIIHEIGVQLIRPFRDEWFARWRLCYGSPEDVLAHFAFTTEQFAVTSREAILGLSAIEDTRQRRLAINHITDPAVVAWRAVKYGQKGYSIDQASMQRLFETWSERHGDSR